MIWRPLTLRLGSTIIDLSTPVIMGILNVTTDSFSDGGRYTSLEAAEHRAGEMLEQGATIIDIGGQSTRPGATKLDSEAELALIKPHVKNLTSVYPDAHFSIDTFYGNVASWAIDHGIQMVNDISAWNLDSTLLDVIKAHQVPYVLMHMKGTPKSMQDQPGYQNVTADVLGFLVKKLRILLEFDLHEIIVDPGFGFGKSLDDNYELLANLNSFGILEKPLLVGLSRKTMIQRVIGQDPHNADNGTTALHAIALERGAHILRCHNIKMAMESILLWKAQQVMNKG